MDDIQNTSRRKHLVLSICHFKHRREEGKEFVDSRQWNLKEGGIGHVIICSRKAEDPSFAHERESAGVKTACA